jgi:hypothetical protein
LVFLPSFACFLHFLPLFFPSFIQASVNTPSQVGQLDSRCLHISAGIYTYIHIYMYSNLYNKYPYAYA